MIFLGKARSILFSSLLLPLSAKPGFSWQTHRTWNLIAYSKYLLQTWALGFGGTGGLWRLPKHFAALKCSAAAKRRHSYKPLWFWPLFHFFLPLLFQLLLFYLSPPHPHGCISLLILSPTPIAEAHAGAAPRCMCTLRYLHPFWRWLQLLPEWAHLPTARGKGNGVD